MASFVLALPLFAQVEADSTIADLERTAEDLAEIVPDDEREPLTTVVWITSARWPLELRSGFHRTDSTSFLGPPVSIRSRLLLQIGDHVRVGLVVDKDSGEPFGTGHQVFDLQAWSVSIRKMGPVDEAVFGAFRPQFGLGLAVWTSRRIGRLGASLGSTGSPRSAVRANTSVDETMRLQGASFDLKLLTSLHVVGFAGWTQRDAVFDSSGAVTSLPVTGMHRNSVEIARKNTLKGSVAGGSAILHLHGLTFGLSTAMGAMEEPFPAPVRAYQLHRFVGRTWTASSAFWRITGIGGMVLSGEVAVDDDRTAGALIVGRVRLRRGVDVFAAWRDYPASYNPVFGAPLGATSSGNNERGLLMAVHFKTDRGRLTLERDVFRRPWLQATASSPSIVDAWRIEIGREVAPARILLRVDLRREQASAYRTGGKSVRRLRARLAVDASKSLRAVSDLVLVRKIEDHATDGSALGQLLEWRPGKQFRISAGLVIFSSESGNASLYLYEADVPGHLTVSNLTGTGERAYLLFHCRLRDGLSVWLKGAVSRFADVRTIGSGVDRLTTASQRSISVAVRIGT